MAVPSPARSTHPTTHVPMNSPAPAATMPCFNTAPVLAQCQMRLFLLAVPYGHALSTQTLQVRGGTRTKLPPKRQLVLPALHRRHAGKDVRGTIAPCHQCHCSRSFVNISWVETVSRSPSTSASGTTLCRRDRHDEAPALRRSHHTSGQAWR